MLCVAVVVVALKPTPLGWRRMLPYCHLSPLPPQTVQKRGATVIEKRGLSSAMSAAKAIVDHMRSWWFGTADVSIAVEHGTRGRVSLVPYGTRGCVSLVPYGTRGCVSLVPYGTRGCVSLVPYAPPSPSRVNGCQWVSSLTVHTTTSLRA